MDELQESLKDLRDIHQPDPISFWPPAPGWWLVLLLFVCGIFLIRRWMKKPKMPKYRKFALEELKNITTNYEIQRDAHKTANECALLIRKMLLVTDKEKKIAGMINEEWLIYLDKRSETTLFSQGAGRVLAKQIYQKDAEVDALGLIEATRVLVARISPSDSDISTNSDISIKSNLSVRGVT